jgi:diguanylate cyclase (GGDEF)-like protein
LCQAVRAEKSSEGYVLFLLLAAKDAKVDMLKGLDAGADDFISKPPERAELIARLNTGIHILELERSLISAKEEIRILSISDSLTGCYNRGFIMNRLPTEIKRAARYGHPLSIIMCDIDHFKQINDSHGHQTGDLVLIKFVQWIRETLRNRVDWIARYGGAEFLIVLPETDLNGASNVAERVCVEIANKSIEFKDNKIQFTASFGVTGTDGEVKDGGFLPEELITQADNFLYQAKQQGRNRVISGLI